MKRSSRMVPMVIMIVFAVMVTGVVLTKNAAPELVESYDVLGFNDRKVANNINVGLTDEDDSTNADVKNGSYNPNDKVSDADDVVDEKGDVSEGEDVAEHEEEWEFLFNTPYVGRIESDQESNKIEFFTSNDDCDYRVNIKTKISDDPLEGNIELAFYDDRGIVVEKTTISPSYSNSTSYRDEFNVDFHPESSATYTLKISEHNNGGDYQIAIYEIKRDAGYSAETATQINVGDEITATVNSTISDWYAFNSPANGQYQIEFHNIDTGDEINVRGFNGKSSLFSTCVENESGEKSSFFAREGLRVTIEVAPPKGYVGEGTYIMSLKQID